MASIADVWVSVLPSTDKIAPKIKEAFRSVDNDAREAGQRWGREIERGVGDVKVKIKADTTEAKAEIDSIDGKTVTVNVDVDRSKLDSIFGGGSGGGGGGFGGFGGGGGAFKLNAGLVGVGLLPSAALAITNVAGAIQQLAGAGLVLPGVFAGIASSMGVAALATHGMSDAFTALDKASDGTKASVEKANEELAKLPPAAADAVKTVYGLKGTFEDLQKIASANLFEGFSGDLTRLAGNLLPTVSQGIDGISRSLNQNLRGAMTSLGSYSSQGFLSRIFGNTATAQSDLTKAIDPIIHAFGTLAAAGSDSLPRLANAVGKVAERFNAFITSADGDGRLQKWISEGLDGFTHLGNIALDLGKSFTAITQAAGGGTGLLGTLHGLTERMSAFLNSSEGQEKLKNFFSTAREQVGQLRDIAVQLGPVLQGVFQSGLSAANLWLPVIRQALDILNRIPGGAQAVVTAFVAWKTIQGPISLLNSLTNIGNVLGGLGGKAQAAGGALNSALTLAGPLAAAAALAGAYDGILHKIDSITGTKIASTVGEIPGSGAWFYDRVVGDKPWLPQPNANVSANPNQRLMPGPTGAASVVTAPSGTPYDPFAVAGIAPGAARNGYGIGGTARPNGGAWSGTPALSTYSPPVITEVPKGSSSTPNLPYTGTADPYAGTSGYGGGYGDAALLASVPAGRYDASGDLSKGLGDCSSAIEDLINIMNGQSTAGRSMATGNEAQWLTAHGFMPTDQAMPGTFQVGFNGVHTQATLPGGTNFNWGSNAAAAKGGVDGTGAWDPAFTQHYYLPPGANPMGSMYGGSPAGATGLTSQDLTLRNAQQRVNDTQHTQEQAQARLNELNAKGTATNKQKEAAEYSLAKATREHQDAVDGLTVATDKYNKSAGTGQGGDTGGNQLGQDIFGGIAQIFGFDGSVFADPTQFGLFKLFKGAMGLKPAGATSGGAGGSGGGMPGMPGGGGGLFDGLAGLAKGLMPGAGGMPGMPGGNSPNIADMAQFKPAGGPGSPGPGNDPSGYQNAGIDLRGASFGDSHGELSNQLNSITSSQNRWGPMLQNAPK